MTSRSRCIWAERKVERKERLSVKKDTFGINMRQYCRDHESTVCRAVLDRSVTSELIDLHREKIRILQHERLVHLIVTVMVVFVELFAVNLTLLHPELGIYPALVMLGFAVLLGFYFRHYFFLENTVQLLYKDYDTIYRKVYGFSQEDK